MQIGRDHHRYEVDHHWGKLPKGKSFGYTHGVTQDRDGRIIIANMSKDAVMFFDPEGNFIDSWGEAYAAGAHGLTLSVEGNEQYLYLANTDLNHVAKTGLDGTLIWKAEQPPRPDIYPSKDAPYIPSETAVAPNGNLYIADGYGQSWIHIYTLEGEYLDSFGGPGTENGRLKNPHGISIDTRGGEPVVQVANRHHTRIDNFTLDGRFIETMISPPPLRHPCTTKHAGGEVYIPDLFCRISIFDKDNRLILHLGDLLEQEKQVVGDDLFGPTAKHEALKGYPNLPPQERQEGKFIAPHDLHIDDRGNIYLVEWIEDGRVSKLTRLAT